MAPWLYRRTGKIGATLVVAAGATGVLAWSIGIRTVILTRSQGLRLFAVLGLFSAFALVAWGVHRRRLTDARRAADEQLVAAGDRLKRMQEMLLTVSHRLRTPLTSIYGLSEVLVHTKRIQGLDRELVTLINSEASDLHRIAEDVLVAAQLDSQSLELDTDIISLREVIEEAAMASLAAGASLTIHCSDIWVLSDATKLRQILRNIISNAVRHGAEPIAIDVTEANGVVQCRVTDHGPGLPEANVLAGLSAGRGLDVAYRLAELIGASLTSGRLDDVTSFTISWLGEAAAAERPSEAGETSGAVRVAQSR